MSKCLRVCVCACVCVCINYRLFIGHANCKLTLSFVALYYVMLYYIILYSLACLCPPYVSTLSHKRHDFRGKKLLNKKCVLIFSTSFVLNISHYQKYSARCYVTCTWVCMLITRYSCHILSNLNSLDRFSKNSNIKFN
jgi:L-asparagine transporter-like permease